jgi:galactosylgalactosylxylosylprotein 3-beta-glucuronosyltransferase 3
MSSFCRLRHFRSKQKQLAILLLLLLSYFYFTDDASSGSSFVLPRTDQTLSLRAELGYLRKKLAQCGAHVKSEIDNFVPIFVITPTYARPVQKAELTRLANIFLLVPNLHWILVEDSPQKSKLVKSLLHRSGIKYTHLNIETPSDMKLKPKEPRWSKPRGVFQRNEAIWWIRINFVAGEPGVVYFADDDNTYSIELFQEISETKKVSVFPVGLVGEVMVEKPNVVSGKVVGWSVGWGKERPFATDMAGFAVNLSHLLSHESAKFSSKPKIGYQESEFLKHLIHVEDLEPISIDKVLVWHTRTETPNLNQEKKFLKTNGHSSDHGLEV